METVATLPSGTSALPVFWNSVPVPSGATVQKFVNIWANVIWDAGGGAGVQATGPPGTDPTLYSSEKYVWVGSS
jgi:hypothetical protein